MLEKDIESRVCRYAESKGFLAYKFTSPNRRSVPDRLFIGNNNIHFFIEFKAPGKKPTLRQHREIQKLREKEHHVYIIDDVDTGKAIINLEAAFRDVHVPAKRGSLPPQTPSDGPVDGHGPR